MSLGKTQKVLTLVACIGASTLWVPSAALALAGGASTQIGVYVEQTIPPTTTTSPPTTTAPPTSAPKQTVPTSTVPTSTVPTTTTPTTPTKESFFEELMPDNDGEETRGFVSTVKSITKATGRFFKEVISGKPVADAMAALLPEPAAVVVVPAIRTASTFVFPIGLAAAVIAFLGLQQRIDARDPKLQAAPLGHADEKVTFQ